MMKQRIGFNPKCIDCGKEFVRKFIESKCNSCCEKNTIENERKLKALNSMNNVECGFCFELLSRHDEFKLKQCLYSLRGYVIKTDVDLRRND